MTVVDQSLTTTIEPAVPSAPQAGKARSLWLRSRGIVQPLVFTVIVLALWQLVIKAKHVSNYLAPAPSSVWSAFWAQPSLLLDNLWVTVQESVYGLLAAMVVGTLVGAVLAYSGFARRVIYPYLVVLHITPIVAIAPLLAIWFGLGMNTKVIVTFTVAFFPLVVGAASGLRAADSDMITLMRSMNASEWQVLWRVRLPAAAVPMMAGLRVAAPLTVVGAVVAEFVSPDSGLGYLILEAKAVLDTASLFLAVAGCAFVGLVFFGLAAFAERRILHWHPSVRNV